MKRKWSLIGIAILLVGCDYAITENSTPLVRKGGDLGRETPASVTAMTWNVYVGTNVDNVIAAPSPVDIPFLVAEAFETLLATNFEERAEAFAKEIENARPHLVGLQEISTIRIQSPSDLVLGGSVLPEDVLFDYLEILMGALAARGLDYRVAAVVQDTDVELPMFTGTGPLPFDDIRLTDFDVILTRGDVAISNVAARNFAAKLTVPIGEGQSFDILRGFTAIDATIGDRTYRFVNTHLEPAVLAVREAQAAELIQEVEDVAHPVILVGDLNTPAPDGITYITFLDASFVDAWDHRRRRKGKGRRETGNTANHANDLRNETVTLEKRIDFILVRNLDDRGRGGGRGGRAALRSVFATVLGDELDDRTPSGLWPSDHAGVVARMVIPKRGKGRRKG